MSLFKTFHPEVFQGQLNKKKYFEGWYLKHTSKNGDHVISLIPGIALNSEDPHAFIQVINGISGESNYISYPLDSFKWDPKSFDIQIGHSRFSSSRMDLNINHKYCQISGTISYENVVSYPGSLLSPGIMGWYSYVPFMECYHGIVSVNHDLQGTLNYNGSEMIFASGMGYIEKDWGTSFPEAWIWVQCNNFEASDASFFFSIAKIPWLGSYFIGFISFLYLEGQFFLFSTYAKSNLDKLSLEGTQLHIELSNKTHKLVAHVTKNTSGDLKAPDTGNMSRRIKESNDSTVSLELFNKKGESMFINSGKRAGLEIVEKILEYI